MTSLTPSNDDARELHGLPRIGETMHTGDSVRVRWRRDQMRRDLSARTIQEREFILNSLTRWADGVPLMALDTEQIERWLDACKLSPRSRACYVGAVHVFYAWAVEEGYRANVPTGRVKRPRTKRLVPRPISDADLVHALRQASPRMKVWLSLAAYQGLRCMEIGGLRRDDIYETHAPPLLRVTGKGGHQAVLPLNVDVEVALRQYGLPARGFVFTHDEGRPYSAGTVSKIANAYLHELGIDATLHQLRHWFGTAVWAATKDMRVTQEMMRHSDPATTAGYAKFDADLAQSAVRRLTVGKRD